jgi:glyceraldehyde-3-phosphate dehydrogenase/erythrose-4-phosphate dehydrogenase
VKLKSQLSKVRVVLECTPEELQQVKVGEYVDSGGSRWVIDSINEADSTIVARLTVEEPFTLGPKLG